MIEVYLTPILTPSNSLYCEGENRGHRFVLVLNLAYTAYILILIYRRTWQNVNSKRRLQRIQYVQEGKKDIRKKDITF
jgi:hypothetical protein